MLTGKCQKCGEEDIKISKEGPLNVKSVESIWANSVPTWGQMTTFIVMSTNI